MAAGLERQRVDVSIRAGTGIKRGVIGTGRTVIRIRIDNFHERVGLSPQRSAGTRVREIHAEIEAGRRRVHAVVVNDPDGKAGGHLTGGKVQRAIGGHEIQRGDGRVIGGGVLHGHRAVGAAAAQDGDQRIAAILVHHIRGGVELEGAVVVVVINHDNGVGHTVGGKKGGRR